MAVHMDAGKARPAKEKRLWAESRERQHQLVDDVLALWIRQRYPSTDTQVPEKETGRNSRVHRLSSS